MTKQQDSRCRDTISKLTHEVRNPLTLIYSSLQLIEKECPSVLQSGLWPQIMQDVRDTIRILKDYSASEGNLRLRKSGFRIPEFLSELSVSISPLLEERGIRLLTESDPELGDMEIFADRQRLKEALTNLLLNAADALDEFHPGESIHAPSDTTAFHPQIVLSAKLSGTQLSLCVRDNGPGIPDEYLPTLFDPFVTHKKNGTGLGLGIVRNIAKQHNGRLTVDTHSTAPDTYASFCLTFPIAEEDDRE